jgi:hypothetical protein
MMEMLAGLQASPLSTWVREASTIRVYPTVLTLHPIGLGVRVGVNAAVALSVPGCGAHPARTDGHVLSSDGVGFWVNAGDRAPAVCRRSH